MSLHYLAKHEIAISGIWKCYFRNFGDVNKVALTYKLKNPSLQIPQTWIQSTIQDIEADAGPRLPDRNTMMSTNWSSVWSPSGPTWSRAWSTRLLMNGAQGSGRVFVPRDGILNICFAEHEHYFFACLTVCLRNINNVASPKLWKQLFVSHK